MINILGFEAQAEADMGHVNEQPVAERGNTDLWEIVIFRSLVCSNRLCGHRLDCLTRLESQVYTCFDVLSRFR
jgi:hypothetical protein